MVRASGRARLPRSGPRTGGGAGRSAAAAAGRAVRPGSWLSCDAGRGGPGDAGPGAAAPPRSCRSRRPKFQRSCSARSSTTWWATSTRRYRPRGAPPPGHSPHPLGRARALQDPRPEPRGTPGRVGPREGPHEHRPGAVAGRASCGALLSVSLAKGPVLSAPDFFLRVDCTVGMEGSLAYTVTVIRACDRGFGSIHRTVPVVSSGQCPKHFFS